MGILPPGLKACPSNRLLGPPATFQYQAARRKALLSEKLRKEMRKVTESLLHPELQSPAQVPRAAKSAARMRLAKFGSFLAKPLLLNPCRSWAGALNLTRILGTQGVPSNVA